MGLRVLSTTAPVHLHVFASVYRQGTIRVDGHQKEAGVCLVGIST